MKASTLAVAAAGLLLVACSESPTAPKNMTPGSVSTQCNNNGNNSNNPPTTAGNCGTNNNNNNTGNNSNNPPVTANNG